MKAPRNTPTFPVTILILAITLLAATLAGASPFDNPRITGFIGTVPDSLDWDPDDLIVDDGQDDDIFRRTANLRRLWATWTTDSLYIGVTYQDYAANQALAIYLDLDRGVGPNDARDLAVLPANLRMPDGHRVELVIGRTGAQSTTDDVPGAWLVTDDDGTTANLEAVLLAAQGVTAEVPSGASRDKRRVDWRNAEFRLPWSALYPGLGTTVPPNAVIKAVAMITAGSDSLNASDAAPDNVGIAHPPTDQAIVLTNLAPSVVDFDGDGVPDPLAATISGTATLPGDPGTGTVTVMAELLDSPGRDLDFPASRTASAEGERAWTVGRLAPGRYRLTTVADGYVAAVTEVDVAAGQQVTGIDQTLVRKTSVGGTITFQTYDPGVNVNGRVVLKDAQGAEIEGRNFSYPAATGGTYNFFVTADGDYTVMVTADTYLDGEQTVTIAGGADRLDVDFALVRQTEISGVVVFESGPGDNGTVYFRNAQGDTLDADGISQFKDSFRFFTPVGGDFILTTSARTYVVLDTPVTVVAGVDQTDLSILLPRAALVTGRVAFEGPDAAGRLALYNDANGARRDTFRFAAAGDSFGFYIEPGRFRFEMAAPGYVDRVIGFNVTETDTSVGDLLLTAVRATHILVVDEDGNELPEARATKYNPADGDPFTSTRVNLAARDDEGREDLYDLDGRLTGFRLSALKMDDLSPPTGNPVFYRSAAEADVDSVVGFANGRARFWMSNTVVEVLRVYLAQPDKEPIAGRVVVAFLDPEPRIVRLTVDRDTLTADAVETVTIGAKLFDSALNPSTTDAIPVSFSFLNTSSGAGQFAQPTVLTNANGEAEGVLTATGAGSLDVTATVVINNKTLEVRAYDLTGGETFIDLTSLPGPTAAWRLNLPGSLAGLDGPVTVTAQTIDQFGNLTADAGRTISFSVDPAALGTFDPASAVSDAFGRATTNFTPSGTSGLATIRGDGTSLGGDDANLLLRDIIAVTDPVWYDEPPTRRTFAKTDLTALIVDNTPDELLLEIPFASDWAGLQLHVLFETGFDAAGATRDPFEQPVNYGHDLKPDYVLTSKYSANDYGDFRRWNGTGWEFWNPGTGSWGADGSIQGEWVTKGAENVTIRIPRQVFGAALPDSLLLELYLTQDTDGVKRSAFDSAPLDSTLNLAFDPEDPGPGDWDTALGPVTLLNWGPTYVVKTDFPEPPTVTDVAADPAELTAGDTFILTAAVTDAGDGIGDVLADLSELGGNDLARMYDDGDAGHGDAVAGDGIYSRLVMVPVTNPGGGQEITVSGFDGGNVWADKGTVAIDVTAIVTPILVATDAVGDDHGPNQLGVPRKYYIYPTNIAFGAGTFDLTGLTVFETAASVAGEVVDMIAFQVSLVDFPDPADPGTADWNPLYADLNTTKIDILIDNVPGGATQTLPWRQAAFQPWDAWDYAIVMDGWYKALIPSLGQNALQAWRDQALRSDRDIILLSDPAANTVTALVSKEALGNPSADDIQEWDICVAICSHDFGGEEVLGGIRWVNEARSEWNFGGGKGDPGGDRDSNYMDLMLIPGTGHKPGAPQEEVLDYESPQALQRLEAGLTPVAIEMSLFEDTGPPVIDTGGDGSVVTRVDPLENAPLALSLRITDDNLVEKASFRYRSTGFGGDGWDREVPMGFLGRDRWVVDILPSWLDSNLVYSPIDSTRYLEFEVQASDPLGKTTVSPVTTLQIFPNRLCRPQDATLDTPDLALLQIDGAILGVPEATSRLLVANHIEKVWTGGEADPDTMAPFVELQWDICNIDEAVQRAPIVPEGRPLGQYQQGALQDGIFRQVFLATADSLGGFLDYTGKLPGEVELSLHYPQDWVQAGLDENLIAIYEYFPASHRWVLVGGNVNPTGNNVTATVTRAATYGLFVTEAAGYDPGEVISGISISPNPFSPNGDDLYDETSISFFLSQEVTVTAEIFNIYGDRKQVLSQRFPYTGSDFTDRTPRRVPGLIWDGRDIQGNLVPYGVYVVRILAEWEQAGEKRRVRSNHSLAVIR